jgi:uncharacterized membrane protein
MDLGGKRIALLIVALGIWLISISLTFGEAIWGMKLSNLFSGILLIGLGFLSLQKTWAGWTVGLMGIWLQFSPLVFWEPSALTYLNNTLVGAIAIIFAFNLNQNRSLSGAICPKGWSFNPSEWAPRVITVGLALMCWFISRYLAAFQLGYIDHMTDPFFKDGTLRVITSSVSKDFPVADAGLGAFCYTLEFILGWQGSARRWSEMPWLVVFYGILVIPVSIVSITLIILQPVAVGAWCSWCLGIAFCMLFMILLTIPEFAAVLQLLYQTKQEGGSFWKVFWNGIYAKPRGPATSKTAWRISLTWNLALSFFVGVWLMFSPHALETQGLLATSNYIGGPLISAISLISLSEAFRFVRWVNILIGIGLVVVGFFSTQLGWLSVLNNLLFGILIIGLAIPKGKIKERYGIWEKMII